MCQKNPCAEGGPSEHKKRIIKRKGIYQKGKAERQTIIKTVRRSALSFLAEFSRKLVYRPRSTPEIWTWNYFYFQIFGGYEMSSHSTYINFLPRIFLLGKRLAELPSMIGPKERWRGVNT